MSPLPVLVEIDSFYLVPVDAKDSTLLILWLRRLKSKEEIKCHLSSYTLVTKRDRNVSALPISFKERIHVEVLGLSNTLSNSPPALHLFKIRDVNLDWPKMTYISRTSFGKMFRIYKAKCLSRATSMNLPQACTLQSAPELLSTHSTCRSRSFIGHWALEGMGTPEALQASDKTRQFPLKAFASYEFHRTRSSLVLPHPTPPQACLSPECLLPHVDSKENASHVFLIDLHLTPLRMIMYFPSKGKQAFEPSCTSP